MYKIEVSDNGAEGLSRDSCSSSGAESDPFNWADHQDTLLLCVSCVLSVGLQISENFIRFWSNDRIKFAFMVLH